MHNFGGIDILYLNDATTRPNPNSILYHFVSGSFSFLLNVKDQTSFEEEYFEKLKLNLSLDYIYVYIYIYIFEEKVTLSLNYIAANEYRVYSLCIFDASKLVRLRRISFTKNNRKTPKGVALWSITWVEHHEVLGSIPNKEKH